MLIFFLSELEPSKKLEMKDQACFYYISNIAVLYLRRLKNKLYYLFRIFDQKYLKL